MTFFHRPLAFALGFFLLLANVPQEVSSTAGRALQEDYAELSDSDLDALVAPIALYPDALAAQVPGLILFTLSKPMIFWMHRWANWMVRSGVLNAGGWKTIHSLSRC